MKKSNFADERDQIMKLLNIVLLVTKEAQSYAIQNDIVNLVKNVKLREGYIGKLKEICHSKNVDNELFATFLKIDNESKFLMEKMKLSKNKLSVNLVSLYNGKQVVKYF